MPVAAVYGQRMVAAGRAAWREMRESSALEKVGRAAAAAASPAAKATSRGSARSAASGRARGSAGGRAHARPWTDEGECRPQGGEQDASGGPGVAWHGRV
eukprot:COSAG01_NODE_14823_length_1405_cov_43.957887_1_plen_100_part_00